MISGITTRGNKIIAALEVTFDPESLVDPKQRATAVSTALKSLQTPLTEQLYEFHERRQKLVNATRASA